MIAPLSLNMDVETAPLALSFGRMASVIVFSVQHRSDLAARLVLAPRRDLHARAAAAQWLRQTGVPDKTIADALADHDPRELLRIALADDASGDGRVDPRLHRLLDRAVTPAWCLADYRALHEALRAGMTDALPQNRDIFAEDARHARQLMDTDPIVRRARRAVLRAAFPPPPSPTP